MSIKRNSAASISLCNSDRK